MKDQKTDGTVKPFISPELDAMMLTIHQFRVLAHVTRRAVRSVCTESNRGIIKHTGLDWKTVQRALSVLESKKLIQRIDEGMRVTGNLIVPADIDDSGLRPAAFRLLYHVIQKEAKGLSCVSSIREITRTVRIKHADYVKAVKELKAGGWLTSVSRQAGFWKGTWMRGKKRLTSLTRLVSVYNRHCA